MWLGGGVVGRGEEGEAEGTARTDPPNRAPLLVTFCFIGQLQQPSVQHIQRRSKQKETKIIYEEQDYMDAFRS